ncbi:MAG: hypothetical protein NT141_01050 [candidate division WWE3 bacterium]|nr:hypothetical protein [candidate division WWE3 bacterium]
MASEMVPEDKLREVNSETEFKLFVDAPEDFSKRQYLWDVLGTRPENFYGDYLEHAREELEDLYVRNRPLAKAVNETLYAAGYDTLAAEATKARHDTHEASSTLSKYDTHAANLMSVGSSDVKSNSLPGLSDWAASESQEKWSKGASSPFDESKLSSSELSAVKYLTSKNDEESAENLQAVLSTFEDLATGSPEMAIKVINRTFSEDHGEEAAALSAMLAKDHPELAERYIDLLRERYQDKEFAGAVALAAGQPEVALAEAQELLNVNPAAALKIAGFMEVNYPEAATNIREALQKAGAYTEIELRSPAEKAHFLTLDGESAVANGDISEAINDLDDLLKFGKADPLAIYKLARDLGPDLDPNLAERVHQFLVANKRTPYWNGLERLLAEQPADAVNMITTLAAAESSFINGNTQVTQNEDHYQKLFRENAITGEREISYYGLQVAAGLSDERRSELSQYLVESKSFNDLLLLAEVALDPKPMLEAAIASEEAATLLYPVAAEYAVQYYALSDIQDFYISKGHYRAARQIVDYYKTQVKPPVILGSNEDLTIEADLRARMAAFLDGAQIQEARGGFSQIEDPNEQVEILVSVASEDRTKVFVGLTIPELLVLGERINSSKDSVVRDLLKPLFTSLLRSSYDEEAALPLAKEIACTGKADLSLILNLYSQADRFDLVTQVAAEYRLRATRRRLNPESA